VAHCRPAVPASRRPLLRGLALAGGLLLSACGGSAAPQEAETLESPIATQDAGKQRLLFRNTGLREPARQLVRDRAAWESLWRTLHGPIDPTPPLPAIDFSREMLVVAALGSRPSGGYAVDVGVPVQQSDGALEAVVVETVPGDGCPVTLAMTTPAVVLRTSLLPGALRTVERQAQGTCPR
jgi:hypothetical protein